MSFLSRATYTGDGSTNIFSVPFPYLEESDVYCTVDGVAYTSFTFPTSSTIQLGLTAAALNGSVVVVYRNTAIASPDVTFQGPSLDPADLNTAFLQVLYAAQELNDASALYQALTSSLIQSEILTGLPTTLPPVSGVLWNNGGVLSIS